MIVTSESKSEKTPLAESIAPASSEDEQAAKSRKRNGRSNQRLFWSIVTLIVFAILTVAIWYWWEDLKPFLTFISDQEAFGAYLQSFGILGPLVLWIAQLLQVFFAFIPGHVVLIAAGYVYGFPLGLFFNITFTVAASQLAYLFARWTGRPLVYRLVDRDTVEYWERIANQKGVLFFTITFLLPIFPSDAMNFVAGLSGIDSRRFLVANFLGRFPSAVLLTLIGAFGLELTTPMWAMIILAYIIFFVVGHYAVNRIKKGVDNDEQAEPNSALSETPSD
jgi:uncharacterized membrane protein YdjX (TVP38/TMEM64 family)